MCSGGVIDVVFNGAFGGVGDEEVVVGEGVVVTSSSLEMLTNSCLGGIMVSLIFLEGLEEEALVDFMVELCEENEDGRKNEKDGLFNLKANDQMDVVFDGAFGGVGDEEVVVGEGVVVTSSSLEMLTNSYLGGIMVSLIFLEGLEEEALVEFMVELCKEYEDGRKNEKDGLFNLKANDQISKPIATKEKVSKPNTTAPSLKEDVNEAVLQPKESPKVIIDDSYGPVNEHGYYKDDIDLEQLRSTMDKLMDENKVLDINPNTISEGSGETMHSNPNDKGGLTTHVSAPADVNVSVKGSLWDQFMKTHGVSTSKLKSFITDSDESEVEEVCMPDVLPGGGFLDDVEDDLDCFIGYEDQVYDLPKKARDFCAQYDIHLNSRHRK
ncbi:hypothetical protein Tco_1070453 [Tanacetum coccineum]|uniref:Uncharacterized protein n=1 Tax=Tanacetum coccineum TaxID=301880 RepID=A0ABQ5HMT9_9ASTR